eukprot:TRINITY_DN35181_c0_g1_i1.p1 TRINITY_DN35181_c0_g1~~TRINITY_DN35181_c0_g1_i1.p1  ORF type:complete len:272 (+),score=49.69 TRINITY_DN35181_c0_g1_i1:67-816(+)
MAALVFRLACLLTHCAGIATGKEERLTPASATRDLKSLKRFLDEYEANVVDQSGQSVTHWAASGGSVEAIQYAVKEGANVALADSDGRTPLHVAAISGHADVAALLIKRKAPVQAQDSSGAQPLHRAALAGSADVVRLLTSAAPKAVDALYPRTGGTALHSAAYLGHAPVLEALLAVKASPCIRNKEGDLPLDRYIEEDSDDVAAVLEESPVVDGETRKRVYDLLVSATRQCGKPDKSGKGKSGKSADL